MRLTAAYGLLHRRGFGAHYSADFSFVENPDMIDAIGAEVRSVTHNVLEIQPTSEAFVIEVSGFDRHRALDYRVSVIEEE